MSQLLLLLVCLALLSGSSLARKLEVVNRTGYTIWVGTLGNRGHAPINNGGWAMNHGTKVTAEVANNWSGRVWARTGCKFDAAGNGRCDTGDCDGRLQCRDNSGGSPATVAEFTFRGAAGPDSYDVSLVDGFNIPVTITPLNKRGGGNQYYCRPASCPTNLNPNCPAKLRHSVNGRVVGCKSACQRFNTDQYCCRGLYDKPDKCRSNSYSEVFKRVCPDAYSYRYDDRTSAFVCDNTSGYQISLE